MMINDDVNGSGPLLDYNNQYLMGDSNTSQFTDSSGFVNEGFNPWEDENEYGQTPGELQSDKDSKMDLYGTDDPKLILQHNKDAYKYAGGDNVKWAEMKKEQKRKADLEAAWGTGLKGLSKGLLGLADTMGPETAQMYDYI